MGSDDLFRRRKARASAALIRQKQERTGSPRFLIVCEGTKTEPNYFIELRNDLRIRPQTVDIAPNDGNTPDRIVDHALHLYDEDAKTGDSFDRVFCVFDRDEHPTFDTAVRRIADLKESDKPKPFEAITSTPCFEYWLLLHFGYTDRPFSASGKKSAAKNLISELRRQPGFAKYDKGQRGSYALLKDKLPVALAAAKKVRKNGQKTKQTNPLTCVDLLVEAMQQIKLQPS